MILDRYQQHDSPLHRLDPRVKVVAALLMITGIVLTPERAWIAFALLWLVVGSMAALGRLGVLRVARAAGVALPFAMAAVTLVFTTPGSPLFEVAGITVTQAGVERFLSVLLKSWLAVQVALLLAMTTQFADLLWALAWLRVPRTLVMIFSFMYRYLFTLYDEAQRMLRAREARSGTLARTRAGGSLVWRGRVAGGMVGSLFVRSYERSERIYAAMVARGYRGQMTTLDPPPLSWRAVSLGLIPVLLVVAIQAAARLWG